ncbi:MAG: hypothetical protein ACT4P4_25795 [Betaproteobacteria bacterium]
MAVENRTTATRMAHREFALDCPKLDEQARAESTTATLSGMEQLGVAQRLLSAFAKKSGSADLMAFAAAVRESEEKLALGLFDERPRRRAH